MYQPAYYNPQALQNAQQRLQYMEQQYPQFSQPQQMNYVQQSTIKGRPVSNEEEANAAMIDFDGSIFVFLDKTHGKIYTKQLGLDGNIIFQKYSIDNRSMEPQVLNSQSTAPIDLSEYVKKADVEELINALLEQRFSKAEQKTAKGGNK